MGLHNLLCRPFLFYLVMDNENTDSQSASLLFILTDSFPLTADCEFLIYIHNHISLAVLWERALFVY